jgi:ABC-type transport system involved in cytochrome c biogenesis permease subunit
MTTVISLLVVAGLATLLAAAAAGLGSLLLGSRLVAAGDAGTHDVRVTPGSGPLARVSATGVLAAFVALGSALVLRAVVAGRAPWANLHEVSIAFAVAVLGSYLVLARREPLAPLAPLAALLAAGLVALALGFDAGIDPLVPALQQPLLLTVHVGSAIVAYGLSGLAFLAAAGEIGQRSASDRITALPPAASLRAAGHRIVLLAFPILTIAIVLGSVWANLAWRSYWSNDPKELAAAATWAVFGAYLHVAGRRDRWERLAPWLIVLGFAGVLFTYIGAGIFFVGEHSYAAP